MSTAESKESKTAKGPEKPAELKGSSQTKHWDHVDEASWESFPASDPPGHWAGKDEAPPTLNGEPQEESEEK